MLLIGSACCGFLSHGERRTATDGANVHSFNLQSPLSILSTTSNARCQDKSNTMQSHQLHASSRACNTEVDAYYRQYKTLPTPTIMHDDLSRLISEERIKSTNKDERTNKILIIGDVHGCLHELKILINKASHVCNAGKQFASIVLVGDLCNKGPHSSEVIRYVRNKPYMYSVRGNHDNAALMAALGDVDRLAKEKYSWVHELSDEDVIWMANLPYTIQIPKDFASPDSFDQDILVVHAGLIPNVAIANQDIKTMVTVRNLTRLQNNGDDSMKQYEYYNPSKTEDMPIPVAKAFTGPDLVVFGHDAKRGIQLEKHAIGLDSGCVYGNKLTGIVLPEKEFVSVDASRIYSQVKSNAKSDAHFQF